ncbi:MAG: S1 RNA-binding domain-containing protein [Myxococcota bacterium]
MDVGETMKVKVIEVGQWGAYVSTQDGDMGFVDCAEFSWISASTDDVSAGDEIFVKILKVFSRDEKSDLEIRHSFVASIREVNPEADPWFDESVYKEGKAFSALVVRAGDDFLLVRLSTGALAHILPGDWVGEIPGEDSQVSVRLLSVDLEDKKLRARLFRSNTD